MSIKIADKDIKEIKAGTLDVIDVMSKGFSLIADTPLANTITLTGTGAIDVPINGNATAVHGSVTVWDETTKQFEQVGVDGVGSKELIVNGDFSDGLNGWGKTNDGTIENIGGELVATIGSGYVAPYSSIATSGRLIISADSIQSNSSTGLYMWVSAHQYGASIGGDEIKGDTTLGRKTLDVTVEVDSKINFRHGNDSGSTFTLDNVSVKEALPLSTTYKLQNGTYGAIIKLHTNTFSDADIVALKTNPELIIEWYNGITILPSGIVKGINDKMYYPKTLSTTTAEYAELGLEPTDALAISGTYTLHKK